MDNQELETIRAVTQKQIHDPKRLKLLELLDLLGTEAIEPLDRIAALASKIIDAPISLVSLITADSQIFKGMVGLGEPYATTRSTPLSHSFCQYVVGTDEPLITNDAREHPMLQGNLAIADLDVIAYLGMPLRAGEGQTLGSFCVIDTKPRDWTEREIEIMKDLAETVMTELTLRAEILEHKRSEKRNVELLLEIERRAMLDLFVQDFSHEFRTALSSIQSNTYMLHRSEDPLKRDRYTQQINESVAAITRLIDSMLLLTRIDNLDTGELHAVASLVACVQNAVDNLSNRIEQKSITILQELPADLPNVRGDQTYLKVAIEQLLMNAIAFSTEGNTIEITTIVGVDETSVDIINHREPIPEDIQEYIFQLFYREDPARSERGLGLGLPIAKRIMERYNGNLALVRSDAGSTVFRLTFTNVQTE